METTLRLKCFFLFLLFQFKKINGFANSFYGWGGEDDDLYHRIQDQNFHVYRSPANIARFFMLKHDKVTMTLILTNWEL